MLTHTWQTQASIRPIQRFPQPGEGSAVSKGASPSPVSAGGAALALLWNENMTHFTKDLSVYQHLILKANFISICSAESLHQWVGLMCLYTDI